MLWTFDDFGFNGFSEDAAWAVQKLQVDKLVAVSAENATASVALDSEIPGKLYSVMTTSKT